MKKIILFFCLFVLLIPMFSFAKRGCCSWHGGVAYCASNGRYVCNDGTYSPSCTCGTTSTVYYLTNDQKCNLKYSGTVYRYSDGWCACPGDKKGTSSWSSIYGCSKQIRISALSTKDIQCSEKYPGTVYRSADGWCACPGDRAGTSSWKKSTRSC